SECDVLTRLKVKAQWRRAYSHGHNREDFAQAIWRALFAQVPDSRTLFKRVHGHDTTSPEFQAHALRVLAGFDIAISTLDQPDALKAELDHLEKQHEGRHIPDNYFDAFKTALLHVLPAQLGRCWDKDAWSACFDHIAHGIKG
uniref:Extracellular globin n=1 Tax=Glossoscolex paulistus TaxID=1046353 RepID=A0A0M3KKX6_9ANNE|nr:Chain B, Globin b Chain [Glossoscolex paulistus]4U8U_F Chain F, Globin b Chain [Glossoscolex paulistus]4U8U_J Chain J, Globin b Chain [Glossoscolex paulistus]4U8U_Q Chain Q, Globin b Chain [Glossoscolex paulistus]4U8U_U Chain U, Globin b Chain [Glossoscolex paulistus]4U8U_Y Chain Y, Globin b Chain [Glossoscolex paulistus]4U8U_f Chain f, Globin b Chain [Glossoscolex paulistus]4U8U_j Chain j, Globin b Chain [Glossoscolex paulistus]4U8U_n Chain n, Globin b Chain [Glossoscolex paulistus]